MKIHFKKILVSFFVILGFVFYAFYQRNTNVQQNFLSVPQDSTSKTQLVVEQPLNTIDTTTSTSNPPAEVPESISLRENENEDEDEDEHEDEEEYYANQTLTSDTTTTTTVPASTSATTTTTSAAPAEITTTTVNAATGLYKDGQYDGNAADAYYGFVQVRAIVQGGKIVDVQFLSYPNDRSYSVEINNYAMPKLKTEAITVQNAQVNIVTGATNTSRAFITSLSSALNQAQV